MFDLTQHPRSIYFHCIRVVQMTGDKYRFDHPREGVRTNHHESTTTTVGGEPRTVRDKSTMLRDRPQDRQIQLQRHQHPVPWREVLQVPLPWRQRPTGCMRITQAEVTRVHPLVDGSGLPGMHRPTHDMVRPLFWADRGQADAKVEQMHVEYKSVVVCVVDSAMPGEAAAYARHIKVEVLHGFVEAMLCAVSHHDIGVAQLLLIGLQELADYGHHSRLDPHPSGGKGLEKLG